LQVLKDNEFNRELIYSANSASANVSREGIPVDDLRSSLVQSDLREAELFGEYQCLYQTSTPLRLCPLTTQQTLHVVT
jgi:hypothetical protein